MQNRDDFGLIAMRKLRRACLLGGATGAILTIIIICITERLR